MRKIRIRSGGLELHASLNDSVTSNLIWEALPITGRVQTWGEEIYFPISVDAELDDTAAATVDRGAVAYWPPGSALCLFWGPTPASRGDEIRPASPVNVCGTIDGDPRLLADAPQGGDITIEAV